MGKKRIKDSLQELRVRNLCLLLSLGVAVLPGFSCTTAESSEPTKRSDMIVIDTMKTFGDLQRAPVVFLHDKHTEALKKEGKDCDACHIKQKNKNFSQKFMRLKDQDHGTVLDIYHIECLKCHTKRKSENKKAGPVACGECHQRNVQYVSARKPISLDKSLHYRHVTAHEKGKKCESCHHEYDKINNKIIYKKGNESSCGDVNCHAEKTRGKVRSFRLAVHEDCISCHRERTRDDLKKTGKLRVKYPQRCQDCHDAKSQSKLKVVKKPARMKRKQPDIAVLQLPKKEIKAGKLKTVPFSHVLHEEALPDCKTCHHKNLKKCSTCHTLKGTKDSKGLSLQHSMHTLDSQRSCIGCHEKKKADKDCSGCHIQLMEGHMSDRSCGICHIGPDKNNPVALKAKYHSMSQFVRPMRPLSFPDKDIPEKLKIAELKKDYQESIVPHRKIVKRLLKNIKKTNLAKRFHVTEDMVCQSCHHHTPLSSKPPKCETCHSDPFFRENKLKSALKGVYHVQCIGCHNEMKLQKPKGCEGCHKKKDNKKIIAHRLSKNINNKNREK